MLPGGSKSVFSTLGLATYHLGLQTYCRDSCCAAAFHDNTPQPGARVHIFDCLCVVSHFFSFSVCLYLSLCLSYIYISLCLPTRCPWPQTSRRSSQGRTAPPSLSKALGVANHQFSVARRAVAVASPYCRRRPLAPSSRQPKSPRPRFPAQGKVRRDNQRYARKQKKLLMKNGLSVLYVFKCSGEVQSEIVHDKQGIK